MGEVHNCTMHRLRTKQFEAVASEQRVGQNKVVEAAFKQKLAKTSKLHRLCSQNLQNCAQAIKTLEEVGKTLEGSHAENKRWLAVCEECLETRATRPQRERVRDECELLLEQERAFLLAALQRNRKNLQDVNAKISKLKELQAVLENDRKDKGAALLLDVGTHRLRHNVP